MRLLKPFVIVAAAAPLAVAQAPAHAQQKQPNIVVIWGDDIGFWNPRHDGLPDPEYRPHRE
jgi:hypothetical protein